MNRRERDAPAPPSPSRRRATHPLAVACKLVAFMLLVIVGTLLSIPGVPGPGFVFYAAAFGILLSLSPRLRKRFVRFKRRHPRLEAWIDRWRDRLRRRRRRAKGANGTQRDAPR